MEPSMEFGGYVDPPSHLHLTSKKQKPEGRSAELRTIPDYDYTLFRYSKLALPFLVLIILSAGVLLGLSFWQGPYGYIRGRNGMQNGIPRDFHLDNNEAFSNANREAGLRKTLRSLRCANFVMGLVPLILVIFTIRAEPRPAILRAVFYLSAFVFLSLSVTSSVSFALGISQVQALKDCPDLHFNPTATAGQVQTSFYPIDFDLVSSSNVCWRREQLTSATIAADGAQAATALVLGILLIYTTLKTNWAWGPGKIPVEQSFNQPRQRFPPPSPFTHIAETRRTYVWISIFLLFAFVLIAFILTIIMHELRIKPRMVDSRGLVQEKAGWPQRNNRLRVALSGFTVGFAALSLIDLAGWKRRLVSYGLGVGFFWIFVGMLIIFAMDVRDVNHAKDMVCPANLVGAPVIQLKCFYFAYYATCFVDFWLAILLLVYVVYEYIYRTSTWDTFYFYADSEWLRNHSLFVEQTDREAFDWKKYALDNGKEFYYSPSLGISCWQRPRNFVEPGEAFLQDQFQQPFYPPVAPVVL
jgi:cell division protein FtsL